MFNFYTEVTLQGKSQFSSLFGKNLNWIELALDYVHCQANVRRVMILRVP